MNKLFYIPITIISIIFIVFIYNFIKIYFFTGDANQQVSNNYGNSLEDYTLLESNDFNLSYPNPYKLVKNEITKNGEIDIKFTNPNTKAVESELLSLNTRTYEKELPNPSFETCEKMAESMRTKKSEEITAKKVLGGISGGNGIGCQYKIISKIDGVNDSVIIDMKDLWLENSNKQYTVKSIYYLNASKSEAKVLKTSIDLFSLK